VNNFQPVIGETIVSKVQGGQNKSQGEQSTPWLPSDPPMSECVLSECDCGRLNITSGNPYLTLHISGKHLCCDRLWLREKKLQKIPT